MLTVSVMFCGRKGGRGEGSEEKVTDYLRNLVTNGWLFTG